ncbi:MAG: hypothetical protein HFG15_03130 [Bacilli bacterium]|nr:hypothetical protein [Bacilli bacterium]
MVNKIAALLSLAVDGERLKMELLVKFLSSLLSTCNVWVLYLVTGINTLYIDYFCRW